MGRRKRKQTSKYARQFANVIRNKARRFEKHPPERQGHDPDGASA